MLSPDMSYAKHVYVLLYYYYFTALPRIYISCLFHATVLLAYIFSFLQLLTMTCLPDMSYSMHVYIPFMLLLYKACIFLPRSLYSIPLSRIYKCSFHPSPTNHKIQDPRIHACLYFIPPTGHSLRPIDIDIMSRLAGVVNVIPVIGKGDLLGEDEGRYKKRVCVKHQCDYFHLIHKHQCG